MVAFLGTDARGVFLEHQLVENAWFLASSPSCIESAHMSFIWYGFAGKRGPSKSPARGAPWWGLQYESRYTRWFSTLTGIADALNKCYERPQTYKGVSRAGQHRSLLAVASYSAKWSIADYVRYRIFHNRRVIYIFQINKSLIYIKC